METMIEHKKDFSISASRLKTYQQCKKKYHHKYVLKEEEEIGFHTLFGSLIHSCLEQFHQHPDTTQEQLLEIFRQEFAKAKYASLDHRLFQKGHLMLKEYLRTTLAKDREILMLEQRFKGFLPNGLPVLAVIGEWTRSMRTRLKSL